MLKNTLLKKTVCVSTVCSFMLVNIPTKVGAYGYRLSPESFSEMYSMAQSGNVEGLRASVFRGMNIDTMDENGNTGLCIAARRHDSYTYNSFRAAGANPRHPCTQNIDDYEEFVTSSKTVPVTSTSREAYGTMGKEEYSISPAVWWWLGGAVVAGGILAIVLGSSGGGSHHDASDEENSGSTPKEDFNSLGAIAGTEGTILNTASSTVRENSSYQSAKNTKTDQIKQINLNSNILNNTKFLDVLLKAVNSGRYTNTINTVLQVGEGVIGMNAVKNSFINNFGYINVDSYNASIGMVASEGSTALNYGNSNNNGISLNFSGSSDSDTIIGMYADNNSTLHNYGDIRGSAIASHDTTVDNDNGGLTTTDPSAGGSTTTSSAANGTLIGMEAMIINSGTDLNKNTTRVYNEASGNINLSAGDAGASGNEIKVSIIGMGSFLDNGFMNGSKDISRAESVLLNNSGNITLSYTGNYTSSSDYSLRKGTGGIIGIRADANTTSNNIGNINMILDEYSAGSSTVDVAAGMQSVHGGNLNNSGTINIVTSAGNQRRNYGMLSVEGSGTVSGLYTNLNQKLINSGNISVQASNSFGMASFNGGELTNSGNITIGKNESNTLYGKNIAMYGYGKTRETKMENTGTIDIYSHDSIAMQNDFAGGTTIYNKGIINIHESATNSYVFAGSYSEAHNSGTINYAANSTGQTASEGIKYNPFANYSLSVGNSIISTLSRSFLEDTSAGTTSSNTEKIYNDADSVINMNGSSFIAAMAVESGNGAQSQGKAYNNGAINIQDRESVNNTTNTVGMYLDSGTIDNALIENNGSITTNSRFSAAMASESVNNASMVNNGTITASSKYSLGMSSSGFTNIQNNSKIKMNEDHSVGIYISGNAGKSRLTTSTNSSITVGNEENSTENSYGIYIAEDTMAAVENNGIIDVFTKVAGAGVYSSGSDVNITNKGKININGDDAYGIFASGDAVIVNEEKAEINVGTADNNVQNSYGIYNEATGSITNKGSINIYNTEDKEGFGIYSSGNSEITNEGNINLYNKKGTAIYAEAGKITNKNTININFDESTALKVTGSTEVINDTKGIINVGTSSAAVKNSNAIMITDKINGSTSITNDGTINLYNAENGDSHAVNIQGSSSFTNNKTINSYNSNTSVIYSSATAEVNNNGVINVLGSQVYAVRSSSAENSLTFNNESSGKIIIGTTTSPGTNNYGIFARSINSFINSGDIIIYGANSYAFYAESGNIAENNGNINMYGANSTALYGNGLSSINNYGNIAMEAQNSTGISGTNTETIQNSATINIKTSGIAVNGGNELNNSGSITIKDGTAAVNNVATVVNDGTIEVTGTAQAAIRNATDITNNKTIRINNGNGIYTTNPGTIVNNGDIIVTGKGNGIYVVVPSAESQVTITNNGTIDVKDGYAIYIEKNYTLEEGKEDKTVVNPGDLKDSDIGYGGTNGIMLNEDNASNFASLSDTSELKNIKFINRGQLNVSGKIDFGSQKSNTLFAYIGKNGTYNAESFSGTVLADSSLVIGGFDTVYTEENAFIGENRGLDILSGSYLFDADLQTNKQGNIKVIMTMASFEDKVDNKMISQFLDNNYKAEKGEKVFDIIKTAENKVQFDNYINKELGLSFVPDLIKQSLDIEKNIDFEMNDDLNESTSDLTRYKVKALNYHNKVGKKDLVMGYKEDVVAAYGYADKAVNNNMRMGLGLSIIRSDSDFDDGSIRHNNMLELSAPVIFNANYLSAMVKPKAGFARGQYHRAAISQKYKASTKEYYYGADSSLYYSLDTKLFVLQPKVGLNLTSLHTNAINEKDNGLRIKSNNTNSVLSFIGTDIKKKFVFDKESALSVVLSGKYFHEFGDKYKNKVTIADMEGYYNIDTNRWQKNYGLISLKAVYDYSKVNLGASINVPIEKKHNTYYLFDIGYKF